MQRFTNILLYVDTHSPVRQAAVERVIMRAKANSAKVKLVDILPELPWYATRQGGGSAIRQKLRDEKLERVKKLEERIRGEGLEVTSEVLEGVPFVVLIQEVLRNGHDILFKTMMGEGGARGSLFGNTAMRLLRKCPCTVELVKPLEDPHFRHVIAAIDPAPEDEKRNELNKRILEIASSLAEREHARFSVLHVWTAYGDRLLYSGLSDEQLRTDHGAIEKEVKRFVGDFIGQLPEDRRPEPENLHIVPGDARLVIPQFIRNVGADILVMGTVARTGIKGLLIGNTAEVILDQVDCSVIAVKPIGFESPVTLES